MTNQWIGRSKVKWQIQTANGLLCGLFDGETAEGALDKMAQERGYGSFEELCGSLNIKPEYKDFENFRIIWLNPKTAQEGGGGGNDFTGAYK